MTVSAKPMSFREPRDVFAGDHELVLRAFVHARGDAETQQHALRTFEQPQVRLREAHRDALQLIALHAAIGVEQAAQESAIELARSAFDGRGHGLAARSQSQIARELGDGAHAEAEFAAARTLVPAGEIRAMVEAARGVERRRHDRMRSADVDVAVADRGTRPDGQLRAVFGDGAVADQQAHEVTLVRAVARIPSSALAAQAAARR